MGELHLLYFCALPESITRECLHFQLVACTLARIMQLHCQFLITASEVLEPVSRQILSEGLLCEDLSLLSDASQSPSAAGQLNAPAPSSQESSQSPHNINQGSEPAEQGSAGKSSITEIKPSSGAVGSPSGLRKISSFFSKLGRSGSGSSDSPQSSFYVSISKQEDSENNDKENKVDAAAVGTGKPGGVKVNELEEASVTSAMSKVHISEAPSEKVQLAAPGRSTLHQVTV